ncbi:hypothetical protein HDZ31DRAFT_82187 [Schizophyllum fasciatum]
MLDDRHRPSLPALAALAGNHLDRSPPAALGTPPSAPTPPALTPAAAQRPEFNLLVAGCAGGKSSFLRLLADTSDIARGTSPEQLAALAKFAQACAAPTTQLRAATVDVEHEPGALPIALTLVDTPTLDARDTPGAERVLADIARFIDARFADAVDDRDARRAASGDQFIHLCIYFLDPDLIVPPAAASRACRPGFPQLEQDAVLLDASGASPLPPRPTLPHGDIVAIKNLSSRVNVLPVISRADVLSNTRLATIKAAVRKDLADAGIGFGIFDEYSAVDTAAAADALHPDIASSSQAPPPTLIPKLPYALISPDIYAHSDGVQRVPPSRHELVVQYTPSVLSRRKILAGKYVRAYRWGFLDVLDHNHCDFMALRGAIFHHMETLRKYTRDYLFKQNMANYRRPVHANPIAPPSSAGARPALAVNTSAAVQPSLVHHASMVDVGRAAEDVHLPSRSLSDSMPAARALPDAIPGPSTKTESRGHLRSKPRKITIACNFCRSRKLKCDGARPGCGQCEKRSHTCEYSATQRRRSGRPKAADELSDSELSVGEPSALGEPSGMGEPSGDHDNKQIQLSPGAPPSRRPSNAADQQHPARRASNAAERRLSNAADTHPYDSSPHNAYDGPTLPPIQALARQDKGFPPLQDGKGLPPMQLQENGYSRPRGPPGRSMFADNELPRIATLLPMGSPPPPETRSAPGMRGVGVSANGLPPLPRDLPAQGLRGEPSMRERELPTRPPNSSREQMQATPARKRAATVPGKSGTGRLTSSGPKVVACDLCRSRKTKCDGGMPSCSSCARKSLPCHYANDRRQANGAKRGARKGTASKAPTEASGSPPARGEEDAHPRPLLESPHALKRPMDVLDAMRPPKKMKTELSALAEVPPVGVGP